MDNETYSKDPKRGSILLEAHSVINGERLDQYGAPEDSFSAIADFWDAYITNEIKSRIEDPTVIEWVETNELIDAKDVALLMSLFKIGREINNHKRDNLRDAIGYLGNGNDIEEE